MDNKQKIIYYDICDKFKLYGKKVFIQHRNLKEFRFFIIERVNPNHRILLYGKFKKPFRKTKDANRIIKVGEILLLGICSFIFDRILLYWFMQAITIYFLTSILYEIIYNEKIFGIDLNVNRNNRFAKFRKNYISC